MGELFRQYWMPGAARRGAPRGRLPAGAASSCSPSGCVAFRDSEGRYGLIDEFCAHRGASLWFGRNEESGLRCAYHGWKYDVTGQCVEVPVRGRQQQLLPERQAHAPTRWSRSATCCGPTWATRPRTPPLPEWEFAHVPPEQTYTSKRWQQCNWLQAFEGGIDSSHVTFLHSGGLKNDPLFKGAKGNEYNLNDTKPFFEVADSRGRPVRRRPAQRRGGHATTGGSRRG